MVISLFNVYIFILMHLFLNIAVFNLKTIKLRPFFKKVSIFSYVLFNALTSIHLLKNELFYILRDLFNLGIKKKSKLYLSLEFTLCPFHYCSSKIASLLRISITPRLYVI